MSLLNGVPIALTGLRALLAPVMVVMAVGHPSRAGFGVCLVAAFLSDVFDGIIARRLHIATVGLRRLDSVADTLFYLGAVFAAWRVHPSVISEHARSLGVLVALEVIRYAYDLRKFGREASYHMWSSKLWGIALFAGFFSLLALGIDGALLTAAIYLGIAADVEGLAISTVLVEWKTDVPTFVHAWRIRRDARG